MAKNAHLDDAFSDVFKQEASPEEGQSLQQKDKRRRKRKGTPPPPKKKKWKKKKKTKSLDIGDFLIQILISAHARAEMS